MNKLPAKLLLILSAWIVFGICGILFLPTSKDYQICDNASVCKTPNNSSTIRVCTFNIKNFSISKNFGGGNFELRAKSDSEKSAVVKVLKSVNADVVMLQEIGDTAFLQELVAMLKSAGIDYPYSGISSKNSPTRLAVISKIEPKQFYDLSNLTASFDGKIKKSPRGTFGAKFAVGNKTWYAFCIHLKSKVDAKSEDFDFEPMRRAEAYAISAAIREKIGVANPILLCGDFNEEPSLQLIGAFDNLNLNLLPQFDAGGAPYTFKWKRNNRQYQYDFFLLSDMMLNYAPQSANVYGVIPEASDHSAVFADFKF